MITNDDKWCRRGLHRISPNSKTCRECENLNLLASRPLRAGEREITPDWYDQVAVDRALKGQPVGRELTTAELREFLKVFKDLDTDCTRL